MLVKRVTYHCLYEFYRIEESKIGNDTLSVGETVQGWLRDSFDNDATPFFALIVCLWGETFITAIVYLFYCIY